MISFSNDFKNVWAESNPILLLSIYEGETLKYILDGEYIVGESMRISQDLCSESVLDFRSINSAKFEIDICDFGQNLDGLTIRPAILPSANTSETYKFQLGEFKIVESKKNSNKSTRHIVAYDRMHELFDMDVTSWFNNVAKNTNYTLTSFIRLFFNEILNVVTPTGRGVSFANRSMHFTEVQYVSAADILGMYCEITGQSVFINHNGDFKFVTYASYPSTRRTYTTNDYYMNGLDYDEYTCDLITNVIIRTSADDEGYSVTYNNSNPYEITGNLLANAIGSNYIASALYSYINQITYVPARLNAKYDMSLEVGDYIKVQSAYEDYTVPTYILRREIKGVNSLRDTFTAEGTKTRLELKSRAERMIADISGRVTKVSTDINGITMTVSDATGKVSQMEQTVDGFRTTVADATGRISTLEQTVDGMKSTVEDSEGRLTAIEQDIESIELKVVTKDANGYVHLGASGDGGVNFTVASTNFTVDANGNVNITGDITAKSLKLKSEYGNKICNLRVTNKASTIIVDDRNVSYYQSWFNNGSQPIQTTYVPTTQPGYYFSVESGDGDSDYFVAKRFWGEFIGNKAMIKDVNATNVGADFVGCGTLFAGNLASTTTYTNTKTSVASRTSAWTNLVSIKLTKGVYYINATAIFNISSSTGVRGICFSTSVGVDYTPHHRSICASPSAMHGTASLCFPITVTQDTTYYLNVIQSSGSSVDVPWSMVVTRLR